jgi:NADH:ubiquinone reductase (non-electrogenic)
MRPDMKRPRLLLLGSGFAAFSFLKHIDVRRHDVTVISPRNHFLFTPLLPSTTVGTVEFRTIIEPLRARAPAWRYLAADAEAIDVAARRVTCRGSGGDTWDEQGDVLVIAVGCVTNTFGIRGVSEHACFLKELSDARRIRQRLVANLERAMLPCLAPGERDRLLHFVSVGAGPTGVRFAAELYDLLTTDLPRSYPELTPHVRVTLLDAGKTILSSYDEHLRAYVANVLLKHGVDVQTGSLVQEVTPRSVRLADGREIPCGLVLWCAGFGPHPLVAGLGVAKDRSGRIAVDAHLAVPDAPGVYAMGDCANPSDQPLPQLAQVAEQQGRYLARSLNARARGAAVEPFRWWAHSMGSYLGRHTAVMDSPGGGKGWTGTLAYHQWQGAIWGNLVSRRNKILVPLDRLRAAVFGRELSRI